MRSGSRRLFVIALVIAAIAHLPALPFDPIFLARILAHTARAHADVAEPENREVLIPVDLDLLADVPRTEDSPPPPSDPPPAPPNAVAGPGDNGASAAPSAGDASPARSGAVTSTTPKSDDTYDEFDKPKRATSTLKDPIAVAGGPGKFGPKDAFVQVLFNGNRLRGNAAGASLGGVLTALPDWKSFFQGTKIDPIADTEHLLIAGPQFRKSRDVVVWMQYRVPEAEMREAIDTLVKRTKGGRWIEDAPVPAAIAKAHDYKRIFALVPGKRLLVILPLSAKDQLAKIKTVRPFDNTSKAGIVIALTTPKNAFVGYEDVVDVPASFKWLRMVVTPLSAGGADVALEIGDSSAEAAAKNAPGLEKQLAQVRTLAKIATVIGADVLPPMKVEVDKDILRVNATVTQKGLNHILNLARTHFAKKAAEDAQASSGAKDDDEPADKAQKKEKEKVGESDVYGNGPLSTSSSGALAAGASGSAAPSASSAPSPSASSPSAAPSGSTSPKAAPSSGPATLPALLPVAPVPAH